MEIPHPVWKDKVLVVTEHNSQAFTTPAAAHGYIAANGLKGWRVYGLRKAGVSSYHVLDEVEENLMLGSGNGTAGRTGGVGQTLRELFDHCGDERDVFIIAAESMGVKKGTATTYWYTIKKERE